MSFGYDQVEHVSAVIADPGASKKINLLRADQTITIKRIALTSVTAGTAVGSQYQFEEWTNGTAIVSGATGTVVAGATNTAATALATANVPATASLVSGSETITSGNWLVLNYTKGAGDGYPEKLVTVQIEYVRGVGV